MKFRTSVRHRLVLLVGSQTSIAALLVLTALGIFSRIAGYERHMYQYQLLSIADIGKAMETAATLQRHPASDSQLVASLNTFYERYRSQWETAKGETADAIRFRNVLLKTGASELLAKETMVLMDLEESLRRLNEDPTHAHKVMADLAALHDVNVDYAAAANQEVVRYTQSGRAWLVGIGVLGTASTLLLGLSVQRAIAPRIQRLVGKVRHFQESGVNEKLVDSGKDEIGTLANALDAGFSAIAERDRQHEQFLGIVAHELKTPITSIHGYASLLVKYPERSSLIPQAIGIINRQSWRLNRLIENLFMAIRARSGNLTFQPAPFDLSALVERLSREIKTLISNSSFSFRIKENVRIIGDEALLEHALWTLFICASALAPKDVPVQVELDAAKGVATLVIDVQGSRTSVHELEALFLPFRSVQYENSGVRTAVGLYLAREIVRLHNGRLGVFDVTDVGPQFLMELTL